MLSAPLRGIITPLVTPLVRGALDSEALERLVEHVIRGGVNGIFVLGTTGEGPSLSYQLREEMIRKSCELAKGRVPVLVCVTDTALAESERVAEIAADAGAEAAVLAPPYYFQYSQSDLMRYVELAAFRLALPLFLYNIPQMTKVSFEVETVARAARIPGVLGLKDSSHDLGYLCRLVEAVKPYPEFSVLTGPEEILLEAMRAGSHGGVCGGSNLSPMLFRDLYAAASTGRWEEAARHQATVLSYSQALYNTGFSGTSYLRGLKCALELTGLCRAEFAPPLTKFTPSEYCAVADAFHGVKEK
jgi:dihydrodipicolinate synthase/N-acetylneuraminate lyase